MSEATEQFWQGEFGDEYHQRQTVDWKLKVPFYRRILQLAPDINSVLEVGCGTGLNLRAIREVDSTLELAGCDVNASALAEAAKLNPAADIDPSSASKIGELYQYWTFDLAMTAGVLIHIPPADILDVMDQIVKCADKWVLAIEYDGEREEAVKYRGHEGRLWKRPYGKMYEHFGLKVVRTEELGPEQGFGANCTAWLMRTYGEAK